MKRDDFGMRIDEIRELATKYSKPDLARMVKMGLIDPQRALMAGMMIDRIAKSAMQPPQTTVAEDVLAAPTTAQGQIPPGIMGAPQAPAPSPGVAGLPSGMENMAGGGIVAFAEGGDTDDIPGFAGEKGSYIDPDMFKAVIAAESKGKANAVSPKGARGLAQLMPGTARDPGYGVRGVRDESPEENVRVGNEYLNAMLKKYGNIDYALAAYNWGPGNVDKWIARGAKPEELPAETRNYIPKVKAGLAQIQNKVAMPGKDALSGLEGLIQSAQAAEAPAMSRAPAAPAKPAAGPDYMYQDPFGAPDYTTDGFSLKEQVTPGKPYEPTLQGAIFGYEQVPERSLPPIKPPAKKAAGPTTFEPKTETPPAEEAPAAESRMGPARPTEMDRLIGGLRGAAMEVPKEKSLKDVAKEQEEADVMYGVDKDMFDKLRKDYKETGGKLKDRADKAAGMAFMMFAAGLAGAREGEEWQTASRAGQQALMSYMGAMDKINDNEDRLAQSMRDLDLAENQYKRSRSKEALAEVNSTKRDIRAIQLENAKFEQQALLKGGEFTVEMIKNQNPAMYQTLANIAQEQRDKGNRNYTTLDALRDYQGVQKTGEVSPAKAKEKWASDPMIQSKFPNPEDYVRFVTGGGEGAASGTFNYVPGKGLVPNK